MNWLHPDLLPDTADPAGSIRHENMSITYTKLPCRQEGRLYQLYENAFVIYDCSPEYDVMSFERYKGTVLEEANGSYSWWRSIKQGE